ncbi:hypothetical protein ACFKHW_28725 [Bradyrhizobium lupini]|uniref:hypothetical protein n=1 Tax=Rhizobium lupini TaxID=136996 RepID=UPI0036721174
MPIIISEQTFALANELLKAKKKHARRRRITRRASCKDCAKCGYELYRTAQVERLNHPLLPLLGLGWLGGGSADRFASRPMRQDLLDAVVWKEIARLLEDRRLIEDELEGRINAAQNADPTQSREETLRGDVASSRKSIERLLTA